MSPVLVSYLCPIGQVEAVAWEVIVGSAGSVGAGGSRLPWAGEKGLARCWEELLWPPRVFSMTTD